MRNRRMTRERFLSDSELERFMAAVRQRRHVHQPRDHALFALLANTGMRPSEALALTRGDVHPKARPPWMHVERSWKKHAPQPIRDLVLNKAVAKVVAAYLGNLGKDSSQRLFPFTKRQSQRLFQHYAKKATITPRRKIYALRHTVGMRLWRHTHDIRLIQAIMGHVRQKATAAYVHSPPEKLRAAYELLGTVE